VWRQLAHPPADARHAFRQGTGHNKLPGLGDGIFMFGGQPAPNWRSANIFRKVSKYKRTKK
jgi:hypothetical protein